MKNNNDNNLSDSLAKYCSSDALPMHMPGHKRNPEMVDAAFLKDITEIDGFDDLHRPEGLIKKINDSAANMWGAKEALIGVNGSTGLLLSAIFALSTLGKVLIASNCHISVWHGLELSRGEAVTINPTSINQDFAGPIDFNDIIFALENDRSIKSIVLTSPTYEGVVSDTLIITKIARRYGVLVVIDEAHGAHFGFHHYFPDSSVADIVIKSLHKTLSAPTQTAIMLFYGSKVPVELVKHYKNSLESTSPSYVLMDGICKSLEVTFNTNAIDKWVDILKTSRAKLGKLTSLSLYDSDDPSKFVILTKGITGYELANRLRNEFRIEVEAAFPNYIIAMSGIGDTEITLERFVDAIITIDSTLKSTSGNSIQTLSCGTFSISGKTISEALISKGEKVKLSEISNYIGRVSKQYLFMYPPGIPLLLPGQLITADIAENVMSTLLSGAKLNGEPYSGDDTLFLVDTDTSNLV